MSEFSVKPAHLDAFADHMSAYEGGTTVSGGFQEAKAYASSYTRITDSGSDMFNEIVRANGPAVAQLEAWMTSANYLSGGCAISLRQVAQEYRDTDAEVSARADQLWPGTAAPPLPEDPGATSYGADPATPLRTVPPSDTEVPDVAHWVMDYAGWLSVGSLVLKLASFFGLDPAGAIAKGLIGDYGEVARAGHAVAALAEFERGQAESITTGLTAMLSGWTGNAADSAQAWFVTLAQELELHADELDELAALYSDISQALSVTAIAVGDALAYALDQLLFLAGKLAAAGCLASVPGVNAIAAIVGSYQVWVTQQAVTEFINMTNRVKYVVEGFLSAVNAIEAWANDYDPSQKLPSAPWVNGAQA